MFHARTSELTKLNSLYATGEFQLVVMYGRRRVGKSALIREFCKNRRAIHFIAEEYNDSVALNRLGETLYSYFSEPPLAPLPASWEQLLDYAVRKATSQPFVLALDEFPYLAAANRNLPSLLQRLADTSMGASKLFLILCGSSMSFMEREVLGYKSPLFGRRTAQMQIKPFSFADSCSFLNSYSQYEKLKVYATSGGIPQYLQLFGKYDSYDNAVKDLFMSNNGYFFEEPNLMLKQELRETAVYNAILASIADGASKLNEIATKSGELPEKCHKYLNTLIDLHIVNRMTPVTGKPNARRSVYRITDNMFRFWYRYIFRFRAALESGNGAVLFDKRVAPEINAFCGQVFEEVCRQWLNSRNAVLELPFVFEKIGSWWGNDPREKREAEIDICAVDNHSAIIGECKWQDEFNVEEVVETLERRAGLVGRNDKYLYLFSKKPLAQEYGGITFVNYAMLLPAESGHGR